MTTRMSISGATVAGRARDGRLLAPQAGAAPAPTTPAPTTTAAAPGRGTPPGLPAGVQLPQGGDTTGGRGGLPGAAAAPRPYNRVITSEAKTRQGMLITHRVGDRLYFEIPAKELNKDELVVGRLTRAAAGNQTPGTGHAGLRRLRRRPVRLAHAALGAERQSRHPPLAVVRDHGRQRHVDLPLGTELELRSDHRDLQRRRVRAGQRRRSST